MFMQLGFALLETGHAIQERVAHHSELTGQP